ncbi:hypothetical protein [Microbispora triticiradicis]|nr:MULTISPECIES: hypothetical protein [Microbispora]
MGERRNRCRAKTLGAALPMRQGRDGELSSPRPWSGAVRVL